VPKRPVYAHVELRLTRKGTRSLDHVDNVVMHDVVHHDSADLQGSASDCRTGQGAPRERDGGASGDGRADSDGCRHRRVLSEFGQSAAHRVQAIRPCRRSTNTWPLNDKLGRSCFRQVCVAPPKRRLVLIRHTPMVPHTLTRVQRGCSARERVSALSPRRHGG